MNLARSLALVTVLVVLHQRGSVNAQAPTPDVTNDVLTINNKYTSSPTTIKIVFDSNVDHAVGAKVTVKLPTWTIHGTAAPTAENCGTSTFTAAGTNTGEATATVEFTIATATLTASTACTLTTAAGMLTTGSTADDGSTFQIGITGGNAVAAAAFTTATAATTTATAFSSDSLAFDAPMNTETAVTAIFKCNAPLVNGGSIKIKMPSFTLKPADAVAFNSANQPTATCGQTTFKVGPTAAASATAFATGVANSGEANAAMIFTIVNSANEDISTTACTIVTQPFMTKTASTYQAANTFKIYMGPDTTGAAFTTDTNAVLDRFLYEDGLVIMNPIINTDTTMTYSFKTAATLEQGDKLAFKLPNFVLSDDGAVTTTGCGTTTFTDAVTGTGTTDATITLTAATADLAVDTACAIHFPSGMAKNPATAANSQDASSELANRQINAVFTNTGNACTACAISQSTLNVAAGALSSTSLYVGNPAGSTATMIRLSFGLNVPMQIGDQLMVALPGWSFTNLASGFMTAPTTQWCGSSTFTAYGVNGAQSHGGTSFVMLTLATASLFDFAAPNSTYACHVTLASSATSTATTPATAQAANLATRTMSAILAAGTNINGTAIAVSSATSAAASSNSTSTCTYGPTSTCATQITQSIVISSLTVAAYTGNLKSTYECSYAKMVSATWCTATTGAVTYESGVQVRSSAAARRAATISFVMDVETSVMSAAAVQTAVASGVTAANLVATMTAMNTATGWAVAVPAATDITVNTATFTGAATSSAAVVIPSAIMVLLGSLISLFLN